MCEGERGSGGWTRHRIRSRRQHEVGVEIHDFNASCELFADRQLVKPKKQPLSTIVYPIMLPAAPSRTLSFKYHGRKNTVLWPLQHLTSYNCVSDGG